MEGGCDVIQGSIGTDNGRGYSRAGYRGCYLYGGGGYGSPRGFPVPLNAIKTGAALPPVRE
jgi:hypothetical protein